ncbi:hypothetical protein CDCA_CDCA01G0456 [Cyanidium caldarium]|uniref:Uncharacterized protein n=1 Tax=Cyanidium caldarium TaxID=2771 RepID=A0AAV9IQT6_CYACA|nr:hypothetical protein CDCA_CDCA01G0456 [Cyanidium caldarium]
MTLVTRDRLQWLAALTVLFAFATIFSLSTCSTTWGWAWQRWRDRYVGGGLASTELPPLPPGAARQMQALLEYAKDGQVRAANGTVMDRPARHLFHSSVNDIFEWRVFWLLDPSACHHWDGAAASGRSLLRNVAKRVKRTAIYLRFKPEMSVKVPHDPETRSDVYMNLHDAENGLKVRGVSRGSSDESPYVELKVRVRTHVFRNPLLTQPIVIEVWDKTLHQAVAAAQVGNLSEWRRILREHVEHIQSHDGGMLGDLDAAQSLAVKVSRAERALPRRDARAQLVSLHKRRFRAEMRLAARRRTGVYKLEVTDVKYDRCRAEWRLPWSTARQRCCYRSMAIEGTNAAAVATFVMVAYDLVPPRRRPSEVVGGYPAFVEVLSAGSL